MPEITYIKAKIRPLECYKEGWQLIKSDYWTLFAITLVGLLIASAMPLGILIGPMYCGIYYALLKKFNGDTVKFADLFKGFDFFLPSVVASVFLIVPILVSTISYTVTIIAFFAKAFDEQGMLSDADIIKLYIWLIAEGVVFALLIACIHALIIFSYPLIVEHKLSGFDAFKLSSKAVWKNLDGVVGLLVLQFILGFLSLFLLFVGIYLFLPLSFSAAIIAYKKIFPQNKDVEGLSN